MVDDSLLQILASLLTVPMYAIHAHRHDKISRSRFTEMLYWVTVMAVILMVLVENIA